MSRAMGIVLRVFFCVLMLTTAIGKLLDNRGFAAVIATYQFSIPEPLLLPLGLGVSLAELAIGIALVAGLRLRSLAQLLIAVHVGYLALAVITNVRGLALANCGCFGVFLARPMAWATVVEDTLLLLLSFAFLWSVSAHERGLAASGSDAAAAAA
jgi:hypothetical protein